jgi:integrase
VDLPVTIRQVTHCIWLNLGWHLAVAPNLSQSRFKGSSALSVVVKKRIAKAGIPGDYAGHSLRAGLATAAAAAGVPERAIMAQTGHRSLATLRKYIREGSLFLENAAAKVGL